MSGIAHHLVKRGMEVTHERYRTGTTVAHQGQDDGKPFGHPYAVAAALTVTVVAWFLAMSAIQYVYGGVVATLTMIETPTATAYTVARVTESDDPDDPLRAAAENDEKRPLKEPDLFLQKKTPITSKIRTTIRHLKAETGSSWAPFRGLHVAVMYHFTLHLLFNFFARLFVAFYIFGRNTHAAQAVAAVLATTLLCRFKMLWTHIVISAPNPEKRWYQRFASLEARKKIVLPTMAWAVAEQLAIYFPAYLFDFFGLDGYARNPQNWREFSPMQRNSVLLALATVVLVGFLTIVLVAVPATVTLKRVQASLLAEEEETVVPFDRTFGGRVLPEVVSGGPSAVGMLDAWRTFDWSARFRLVKLYTKIVAIQVAASAAFVLTAVAEVRLINGDYILY
ncbi:MAG: hypothetical protein LQ342_006242 [Letrouitia transgressa]|nr:MAG: hypothetical protein LQ342_006242 [Letrouitia transgressa]